MTKLLIFHHYAEPPGGFWTGTHDTYKQLARQGIDVTIFTSKISHYSGEVITKERSARFDGIEYIFIPTVKYKTNGLLRSLNFLSFFVGSVVQGLRRDVSSGVVIGCTPHPLCLLAAYLVARLKRRPLVSEVHDLWGLYLRDRSKPRSLMRFVATSVEKFELYIFRRSVAVFGLWSGMTEYFVEKRIKHRNILHVPLTLQEDVMLRAKLSQRDRFSLRNELSSVKLVCTARLGDASNVEEFLYILAAMLTSDRLQRDFTFDVYGDGSKRKYLQELVDELKLSDHVKFHGMKSRAFIEEALGHADIAIASLPDVPHYNDYGPIPTKVLQYLQFSVPVIFLSSVTDRHNIVKQSGCWLALRPNNVKESAVEICDYLNDFEKNVLRDLDLSYQYYACAHGAVNIAEKIFDKIQMIVAQKNYTVTDQQEYRWRRRYDKQASQSQGGLSDEHKFLLEICGLDLYRKILQECSRDAALSLELGSGRGDSAYLPTEGLLLTSDLSIEALKSQGIAGVNDRCLKMVASCYDLPLKTNSIDLVCASGLFCLVDRDVTLAEVSRVLRPGGYFVVIDINKLGIGALLRFFSWLIGRRVFAVANPFNHHLRKAEYDSVFDLVRRENTGVLAVVVPLLRMVFKKQAILSWENKARAWPLTKLLSLKTVYVLRVKK